MSIFKLQAKQGNTNMDNVLALVSFLAVGAAVYVIVFCVVLAIIAAQD
jgi:hypothetical protein